MRKLLIALYYLLVQFLPHTRYCALCTKIRTRFVYHLLGLPKEFSIGSKVENRVYFGNFDRIKLGKRCEINEHVFIQGASIGDNVLIAPNVTILAVNHNYRNRSLPIIDQGDSGYRPPTIEEDVWLARNVIVMPGKIIRKGAVVAAGSVVTKDIPAYVVVGGVPARRIGERQ